MRNLARNKRPFAYCLYLGHTSIEDENGNETGEYKISYSAPVTVWGNISPATGIAITEQFGNLENYDKVIAIADTETPINDDAVLFVDKEYETDEDGNPLYDYTVRRVAKSLNQVSIAISKVKVGAGLADITSA